MQPKMCSKCRKNIAVVFITKVENGVTMNEGYCLKCARSLGIPQIDKAVKQMGISDEDLDLLSDEMSSVFGQRDHSEDHDDDEIDSQTATFPLLNQLFGNTGNLPVQPPKSGKTEEQTEQGNKKKSKKHKFLDSYCMDLTGRAREGKLDKVIGRDVETERVIQILNRRQKNNPCLIGEPGVGKTAIAEGLAQRIAAGEVPYKLREKEVFLLDLTALVAGTQFRGQFESRMKSLIGEIKECGNIILVIDEVHNLVGAGDAEGSMNAANILKPALSRGEIQVIGATTFAEYRKYIEKDAALERRFQPVTVAEPTIAEASQIMQGIAKAYSEYHGVEISPEIAHQCVVLSERYITDRFLPDKAIDLLDEACSDVNLQCKEISQLAELKKERDDYELELRMINEDTENQNYERIAMLRSRLCQLADKIEELEALPKPAVTMENLARIIELWTKIPASKIKAQEYQQIKGLADRLKEHIVGQDEAIRKVVRAIRRNRAGIKSPGRPVGSFLFFGPTGVGKTQLAKCIAEYLFGSRENIIRIDMSEYMEKFTASRLTGAPPGYVGYEEGGQLSEKVRRQPYSVVLLDEIEKAHPDIFNLLLQVLDEGRLTDSSGRSVDFRNTILIMTSNVGSREMDEYGNGVGYVTASRDTASSRKSILEKSIRKIFPPEFINRIDEQIQFNPLGKADIEKIIDIEIKDLRRRVSEAGYRLNITPSAKRLVAERGYDPRFGARPLKRAIQRYIEDPVSEYIISCRSGSASATGEAVTIKVGTSPDRQDTLIIPGRKLQSLDIDEFKTEVTDDAGKGA